MLEGTDVEHNVNTSILGRILGREVHYIKVNFRFEGNVRCMKSLWIFFEIFFIHFIIIVYCCTVKTFMEGVLSEFMRIKSLK